MKKLKLILCGLLLSVALVGCGSSSSSEMSGNFDVKYKLIANRKFMVVDTTSNLITDYNAIYVDVETKVQYLLFEGGYYGSMSTLVDADGKPILYDREV